MALINCPECGHQMSDTAKKCPNCGYKQPNLFQSKGYTNLFIGLIISIVSVGLLILAIPTMYGFSTSSEIILTSDYFLYGMLEVVGAGILFFIGCKFFKQYTTQTKKYFLTFIVIAILCIVITMCSHGVKWEYDWDFDTEYAQEEQSVSETTIEEVAEVNAVYGGLKLKTIINGITYEYDFFNDKTLKVIFTKGDDTLIYGGGWEDNSGSYHDVPYKWYELRYSFDGRRALAIIDEDRNLYGPIDGDARIQIAQMIYIVHNDSSDPRYKDIIKYVSKLTEVE